MSSVDTLPSLGTVAYRKELVLHWPEAKAPSYHHFRVSFVGAPRVGKSTLALKMVGHNVPADDYNIEDSFRHRYGHASMTILTEIMDWQDITEEKLCTITRTSRIIFIVFDITRQDTYDFALECINTIDVARDGGETPVLFLVAHKTDLISESTPAVIDKQSLEKLSKKLDITIFATTRNGGQGMVDLLREGMGSVADAYNLDVANRKLPSRDRKQRRCAIQ